MDEKTIAAIDEVLRELLEPATNKYSDFIWRAIRKQIVPALEKQLPCIEETGFTKTDVALALGHALYSKLGVFEVAEGVDESHCPLCGNSIELLWDEDGGQGAVERAWECNECLAGGVARFDAIGGTFIGHRVSPQGRKVKIVNQKTMRTIDEVACEMLKACTDDYDTRIWEAIRSDVIADIEECVPDIEEEGFTKGDVALAIGRAILSLIGEEAQDPEEE